MIATEPCRCWLTSPPIPHAGHCCFDYPRELERPEPGPPPCGHWIDENPTSEGIA